MSSSNFNLDDYVTVAERIQEFWTKYPEGRIETSVNHLDDDSKPKRMVVVSARLFADRSPEALPIATGIAKEREGLAGANKTAFVENCETSAIGRALANAGLLTEKRPSREEMSQVTAIEAEHSRALQQIKEIATNADDDTKAYVKELWSILKEDPVEAARVLTELRA